tara:strand:+ start:110 stop:1126 length:1017 start_codon:yes stop_codon:yes gene_type:complete
MPIALDLMGGDAAPEPIIAGAADAIRSDGRRLLLFGQQEVCLPLLKRYGIAEADAPFTHCDDVVPMDAKPSKAMRQRNSSMAMALAAVAAGQAEAAVSAGASGAFMALGLRQLGRLPGVSRPAIALTLPGKPRPRMFLDAGANAECSPDMLEEFALMGSIYAELVLGISTPRVGLLCNGEEEGKGTELTRAAAARMAETSDFHFTGYAEGNDLFQGPFDVLVTDGFTGNLCLKTLEGTVRFVVDNLKQELSADLLSSLGAMMAKGAFARLKATLDPRNHGGAPLLGLNGVAIVAHGSSDALAIRSALRVAANCAQQEIGATLGERLRQLDERRQAAKG